MTHKPMKSPVHVDRLRKFYENRDMFNTGAPVGMFPGNQDSSGDDEGLAEAPDAQNIMTSETEPSDVRVGDNTPDTQVRAGQWFDLVKLLGVKGSGPNKMYKVQWKGPEFSPSWERAENVSEFLKEQFHIRKTQTGLTRREFKKTRKRR